MFTNICIKITSIARKKEMAAPILAATKLPSLAIKPIEAPITTKTTIVTSPLTPDLANNKYRKNNTIGA